MYRKILANLAKQRAAREAKLNILEKGHNNHVDLFISSEGLHRHSDTQFKLDRKSPDQYAICHSPGSNLESQPQDPFSTSSRPYGQ